MFHLSDFQRAYQVQRQRTAPPATPAEPPATWEIVQEYWAGPDRMTGSDVLAVCWTSGQAEFIVDALRETYQRRNRWYHLIVWPRVAFYFRPRRVRTTIPMVVRHDMRGTN